VALEGTAAGLRSNTAGAAAAAMGCGAAGGCWMGSCATLEKVKEVREERASAETGTFHDQKPVLACRMK